MQYVGSRGDGELVQADNGARRKRFPFALAQRLPILWRHPAMTEQGLWQTSCASGGKRDPRSSWCGGRCNPIARANTDGRHPPFASAFRMFDRGGSVAHQAD
jgi:hypothetical protein